MKKIMLLLVMLSVLLCGCGNSAMGGSNQNADPYAVIVQMMTIDPVFKLYLDENDNILKLTCINDDADKLFADIDIVGMAYQEVVPVILNKAYEMEFFKSTATTKISLEIIVRDDLDEAQMEELSTSLKKPMIEFQEEKEFLLEVNDVDVLDGIRECIFKGGHNIAYRDSNEKEFRYIEFTEDYYVWFEYDTNGVCIKKVGDNSTNYYEQYYDKDENITKEVTISHTDEVRTECLYYENGGIKKYIWDFPDGRHEEQSFDKNGDPISE